MVVEVQHCPSANGLIRAGSSDLPGPCIPLDKFILQPEEVASLQKRCQLSVEELMKLLVQPASLLAKAPISNFPVGCALWPWSGNIYL